MSIAQYIDHTVLKPTTTAAEVQKACAEATAHGFAAVCIPPHFVRLAVQAMAAGGNVKVATVIGFPFGFTYTAAKVEEVKTAIGEGADELDMVISLAALKNGDFHFLETEVAAVSDLTAAGGKTLKLIIESGILSAAEVIKCCEIYKNYPVQFLKTSTGYAEKGASVEAVQLMRKHLPASIRIKASGGIRDYAFARQLIEAGASRLGCSASVAILQNEPAGSAGY